ncbi:MAG: hypothetical protein GY951_17015 [Psychromonas sp.]|nr:hypothetical protein [Alteromonadales bacterium]MCP5079740.1 hypothetical protein [Psychromonas sp.]
MKKQRFNLTKFIHCSLTAISLSLLSACSSFWGFGDVAQFEIIDQGSHIVSRPNMSDVCKGFMVTEQKFDAFFEHANITHEEDLNERYKALPCYSSGITYIDDQKYNWILRAGGVGEFFNDNKQFTKVCGVACCAKVEGVC